MGRALTKGEKRTFFFLSLHGVILYTLFFIMPVILGLFYSMTDWNGISRSFNFIALENYFRIARDSRVFSSLRFNFLYMLVFVVAVNFQAMLLALLLNSAKLKFRRTFRAIFFFPAVLSMVVVGLIFDQIFYHVIPRLGDLTGWEFLMRNLLGRGETAIWGVLFVSIWRNTAVPMVLLIAGLQTVPGELIEASILDGTNAVQRFFAVIFPFLVPALNMTLVLTIKHGIMVFDVIMAMTGGGPGRATEAIGLLVYNVGFDEMRFGYASALSFLLFGIIALISMIQIKVLKTREAGQI